MHRTCLFLDVDGTLLDFNDDPSATRADADLLALLGTINDRLDGALALVSGRTIASLDAIFDPLRLPSAGLHGWERRDAAGASSCGSPVNPRLQEARSVLAHAVAAAPLLRLEDKGAALAVHYRGAPAAVFAARAAVGRVAPLLSGTHRVLEGDAVIELAPLGRTKADAVHAFMQEPPFAGRVPIYLGDDTTDLDGFRAVRALGGRAIGVGGRISGDVQLPGPAAARDWLREVFEPAEVVR